MKRTINKINYMLWSLLAVFLLGACTSDVDDVFEDSSANRIAKAMSETQSILAAAPNGWDMHMYGNLDFGGYNVLVKFDDKNNVTVMSEVYGPDSTFTSHYKVDQSQGVILSFDEYNPIFHFFSDPVNDYFGTDGKGYEADLEFRVLSATADSIVMKGKKHGHRIVMKPLPANTSWSDYVNGLYNLEDAMTKKYYNLALGDTTVMVKNVGRVFSITDPTTDNTTTMPYIVTPEGFEFYEPFTIAGKTISGFKFAEGDTYANYADPAVTITKTVPPLNEQFEAGTWYASYSNIGTYGQAYWNAWAEGSEAINNEIHYVAFGHATINGADTYGLYFGSYDRGDDYTYVGTVGFNIELIGKDEVKLTYNKKKNELNADYYIKWGKLAYGYWPFSDSKGRTFKLTTDNPEEPTVIILTDEARPTNVIKLTAAPIEWPFRN